MTSAASSCSPLPHPPSWRRRLAPAFSGAGSAWRRPGADSRRFFAAMLLALAFIASQQAAVLHWLSHSIEAAQKKQPQLNVPALAADHCDACLAFSGLGTGAAATGFGAALPAAVSPLIGIAVADAGPTAFRPAFRSRAPPVRI